jgi:hypothetical protein
MKAKKNEMVEELTDSGDQIAGREGEDLTQSTRRKSAEGTEGSVDLG